MANRSTPAARIPAEPERRAHSRELLDWLYRNEVPVGRERGEFLRELQAEMTAGMDLIEPEVHVISADAQWDLRAALWRAPGPEARPVLIHYHGGGWQIGNHLSHAGICTALARSGFDVVSVDYRKAPRHRFPAAFDDARRALEWVVVDGPFFGLDPAAIALSGDSAGANLAAAVAACRDYENVKALVAIYGIFDYHRSVASFERVGMAVDYLPDADFDRLRNDPRLSPEAVADRLPPTLLVEAEDDWLLAESEALADALATKGVAFERHREHGVGHGYLQAPLLEEFASTIDAIARFLRATLTAGGT